MKKVMNYILIGILIVVSFFIGLNLNSNSSSEIQDLQTQISNLQQQNTLLQQQINDLSTNNLDPKCKMEPDGGVCKANFSRYYFDVQDRLCKSFTWGGCGGTVPFETLESCQETCEN